MALTLRPFLLYLACESASWSAEAVSVGAESPSDSVSLRALAAAPPPDVLLLLRKATQRHKKKIIRIIDIIVLRAISDIMCHI